jgi:hypothetical protein
MRENNERRKQGRKEKSWDVGLVNKNRIWLAWSCKKIKVHFRKVDILTKVNIFAKVDISAFFF